MNILETTLPVIHLKAGEIYIAEKPTLVATVLGSCISVTMFNNRFKIGAICHGALPVYKKTGMESGKIQTNRLNMLTIP